MRKIGFKTLIAGFLFWYGLGYVNVLVEDVHNMFEVNIVIGLFFVVMIFGYKVGYAAIPKRTQPAVRVEDYIIGSRTFAVLIVVFAVVAALLMLSSYMGGMLAYHAVRVWVALGILAFVYALLFQGWRRTLFLFFFAAVAVYSLGTYSRRPFLTLIAVVFLIPLIRNRYNLGTAFFIGLAVASMSLIAVLYVTGIRYTPGTVSLLDISVHVSQGLTIFLKAEGFDTVHLTEYVLETYSSSNYLNGQTFLGSFINFIPRQLWPDKPSAFGVILSGQYFNLELDELFTNFGPGIVAESYANGGYFAVIVVSVVFGLLVGFLDRTIENNRYNWNAVLFGIVLYPAIFFMIRGDFLNSFYELYSKAGIILVSTVAFGLNRRLRPPLAKHRDEVVS